MKSSHFLLKPEFSAKTLTSVFRVHFKNSDATLLPRNIWSSQKKYEIIGFRQAVHLDEKFCFHSTAPFMLTEYIQKMDNMYNYTYILEKIGQKLEKLRFSTVVSKDMDKLLYCSLFTRLPLALHVDSSMHPVHQEILWKGRDASPIQTTPKQTVTKWFSLKICLSPSPSIFCLCFEKGPPYSHEQSASITLTVSTDCRLKHTQFMCYRKHIWANPQADVRYVKL